MYAALTVGIAVTYQGTGVINFAAGGRWSQSRCSRLGLLRHADELPLSGMPWADVAARTGYNSAAIAQLAVDAYLQKAALALDTDQRRMALQLELDRFDALWSAQ